MSSPKLTRIDPATAPRLLPDDECYFFGEYTSRGGFKAGEYNQLISNLKIPVPVPANRLRWKNQAICACADLLNGAFKADYIRQNVTFVPVPGSKPRGHAEFDDRLIQVLSRYGGLIGGIDFRELVVTTEERVAQHASDNRATVDELLGGLQVQQALATQLRGLVVVVDDVFTLGTSFRAMKTLIAPLPGVQQVAGVCIARTIWPTRDFSAVFAAT